MSKSLNWGILGTGNIAKAYAQGLQTSRNGTLVAVASRSHEKATAFAAEFNARPFGSYEALLADIQVQAVYISTPHPHHAEWAIKAAEAKKHILCEKPIGLNTGEAMAIVEAAIANDVFLMEAFMYRCHPQTRKLVELLRNKAVGEVRLVTAHFGFQATFDAEARLYKNALGGGGILDVGCYTTSMVRLIAGVASGKDFAEPSDVKAVGKLNDQTQVDEYAAAVLKFDGNPKIGQGPIIAQISTSILANLDNTVRIIGSEGSIFIPDPWIPARDGGRVKIIINKKGEKTPREIEIESSQQIYGIEADTVAANIERRQAPSPAMTWDDTIGNMRTLDQWRQQIGLVYEQEKPEQLLTASRQPLSIQPNSMKYGQLPHLEKKVSRLVMGVDNITFLPHSAALWDAFVEIGGNCFDTAHIYGGGACERVLGQWVKARGIREQLVILDKGGHTPECNIPAIRRQHRESLDRLGMGYVDIYMLHRDNPEIPVGEFIDLFNELVKDGTMKTFGGSNWTIQRIEEANAWAKKNAKQKFAAMSNNFSLARMVNPPWPGCISTSDAQSRAWFEKTQFPMMPWSSQARGFFLENNSGPGKNDDPEVVRCWHSDDNFQRLERAKELAKKYGVRPINIALAYVLCQPFPTFPLIGPRYLSELRTSLPGLNVELTAQEVKWLNLE